MSDKTNLGYIQTNQRQRLPPVKIPRRFHNKILTTYSDLEKNDGHNGKLECKALEDVPVRGRVVKAGQIFTSGANEVIRLACERRVEIIDDRMEQEDRVLAEAQRLGMNQPASLEPTDFPESPRNQRKAFAKA